MEAVGKMAKLSTSLRFALSRARKALQYQLPKQDKETQFSITVVNLSVYCLEKEGSTLKDCAYFMLSC